MSWAKNGQHPAPSSRSQDLGVPRPLTEQVLPPVCPRPTSSVSPCSPQLPASRSQTPGPDEHSEQDDDPSRAATEGKEKQGCDLLRHPHHCLGSWLCSPEVTLEFLPHSPKPSDLTLSTSSSFCDQDPGHRSAGASGSGWLLRLRLSCQQGCGLPKGSARHGPPSGSVRWSPPRHGSWPIVRPSFPCRTAHCRAGSFPRKSSIRAPAGRTGAGVLHTSSQKGRPIPCTVLFFLEVTHGPASLRAGMTQG